MRIRAAAAWVGLTLAGMSLPAMAAAAPADAPALPGASTNVQAGPQAAQSDASAPLPDTPSQSVAQVSRWVTTSGDNTDLPFIIIDKLGARIFAFDTQGQSLGDAAVLVGITRGDDSAPGVGNRPLYKIPVDQRTTPAGRFVARMGPAKHHPPVLWVSYADAISLHPVVTANRKEHRLQRIKSDALDDHRISFGCINVPATFYAKVVRPLFKVKGAGAVVYILPDTKSLAEVFPAMQLALSASKPAPIAASATAPSRSAAAQAQR
jgi:hypothetical protein